MFFLAPYTFKFLPDTSPVPFRPKSSKLDVVQDLVPGVQHKVNIYSVVEGEDGLQVESKELHEKVTSICRAPYPTAHTVHLLAKETILKLPRAILIQR